MFGVNKVTPSECIFTHVKISPDSVVVILCPYAFVCALQSILYVPYY